MAKHRRKQARKYMKKAATVSGAVATATAMTVGMAAPPANASNYTPLITDSSNIFNNLLFINGNVGGTVASFWNPLATLIPGGLLPTFTADTEQLDLTSIDELLIALGKILPLPVPDISGIPGLPANATALLTLGLLPGLLVAVPGVGLVTVGTLLAGLGATSLALAALDVTNAFLATLPGAPLITGIPSLEDLFTVTQTTGNSSYDWPLLGLGPLLGLSGSTTFSNTFAQVPSLTGSELVTQILDGLDIPAIGVGGVTLEQFVDVLLQGILNGVQTPSVTAWIPAGQGNYGLPLGGQYGWLATMPTLDIGPVIGLSDTDTVISVPIVSMGAVLPLGLASFGNAGTPGVVFPTATGISTLGHTSVTSFAIPGLGLGFTNLNILASTYVGTNGFNWNGGTNLLTLTTPFGVLPIIYSPGSYNFGTTGFGFTLPSLFGVGLLPPFQIGTAPSQQSPDGLLPASVLNLGLGIPTQATDVLTLLGLPNAGDLIEALLTPVYNILVTPFANIITNVLNGIVGPLTNGAASATEQLTSLLAQLTSGLPGANTPVPFALASANSLPSEDTEFMTFSMASDEDGTDTETAGPDVDATDTEDDGTIEDAKVVDDVDLDAEVDGIDADSTGVEIDEPNKVETNVLKDNPIHGYLSEAEDAADPGNDDADDGTDTDSTEVDVHATQVGNDDAGDADTDTDNGTGDADGADGAGADAA